MVITQPRFEEFFNRAVGKKDFDYEVSGWADKLAAA